MNGKGAFKPPFLFGDRMIVYFVSGHRDVTEDEFWDKYVPKISLALEEECRFVVGDYQGVDAMAQVFLKMSGANVTVYHMFDLPRNNLGFPTEGGFENDEDRDAAMTVISDFDIAWVRDGKEKSGTAQNIQRRIRLVG